MPSQVVMYRSKGPRHGPYNREEPMYTLRTQFDHGDWVTMGSRGQPGAFSPSIERVRLRDPDTNQDLGEDAFILGDCVRSVPIDGRLIFVISRCGLGAPWNGANLGLVLVLLGGEVGYMWAADLKKVP